MKTLLDVRGVSKSFDGRRVLGPVDLTVSAGEFCAITGPSGSGKSTFLHVAGFLETPDEGEIFFQGEAVPANALGVRTRLRREKVGLIFQAVNLLPQRSVLENVLFRGRYSGVPRRRYMEQALRLLERLGLSERADQKARLLSGGEAQRVAIARALLCEPALLLADEPTGNLDEDSALEVMGALSDCAARGIGVLLVTHNPALLRYAHTHVTCRAGLFGQSSTDGCAFVSNHDMHSA